MPKAKAPAAPTITVLDLEQDALVVRASQKTLQDVGLLATKLVDLRTLAAKQEAALKETQERVRYLQEVGIPEAMDACNMKEFTLTDGAKIVVESVVAGSIPKKCEAEAFTWLREHGHAGLIKKAISVALARGQDELGEAVVKQLQKLGVEVTVKDSVHASTLGAWAREMLATGQSLPLDLLGIYTTRRAKVVEPKAKR